VKAADLQRQIAALRSSNDGYTPVKGVDYFDGEPGYTPVKGVDYTDGADGQDSTVAGPPGTTDYNALQNKPALGTAAEKNVGTGTGNVAAGNDSRLSDSRTPLAHSHAPEEVTGTAVVTTDARLSDARPLAAGTDKTKLDGIAAGATVGADWDVNVANKPTVPSALSQLADDATHRLATDTEKTTWNGKEPGNANIQAHVTAAHAPSTAQANADITKAEIEAKLTGAISSHSHAGGGGQPVGFTILANDTLAQALATNINTRITVTAARTLTTTVPAAGTRCSVLVLTSGTTSRTITFGTGFKPVGTLATGTTSGRVFVVNFISDGTNLYEAGRTAAMVA
jgi:hypothetical protein